MDQKKRTKKSKGLLIHRIEIHTLPWERQVIKDLLQVCHCKRKMILEIQKKIKMMLHRIIISCLPVH